MSPERAWIPALLALACAAVPPAPTRSGPSGAAASPPPAATGPLEATSAPGGWPGSAPAVHPGDVGTADPVALAAAAPDGSWVVLCQARADTDGSGGIEVSIGPRGELMGDDMQGYLVLDSGAGQPIDGLLAHDRTGRWLVIRQDGRVVLLDAQTRAKTDLTALGADTRDDRLPYRSHRTLSFDEDGARLLYVRTGTGSAQVVVRRLEDGSETVIDPGPGALWRAELDSTGSQVVVHMLVDDTNGNGRLDWPVPAAEPPAWQCAGPIPRTSAWLGRGDRPVVRVAPSTGGKARLRAAFVAPFGKDLLVREPGGRLLLRRSSGRSHQLAPARCQARVLHADVARQLVVGTCTAQQGRPRVNLLGVTFRDELEIEVARRAHDRWPGRPQRLLPVYPGRDAVLLDLDHRTAHTLQTDDRVLGTWGARALIRRGRALWLFDAERGECTRLTGRTARLLEHTSQRAMVAVRPLVVDLEAGRVLGTVAQRPLAVTRSGRVLVAAGGDRHAQAIARGPLRWMVPTPLRATAAD